jgi:Uncharacterized protein conserved in bacteria (DUF2141)
VFREHGLDQLPLLIAQIGVIVFRRTHGSSSSCDDERRGVCPYERRLASPLDEASWSFTTASQGFSLGSLPSIPPGKYALAVIHDENMNGKLDTNARGSPTEGYSFSNDAKGLFGAPAFSVASFAYDGRALELTIGLQY